MFKVIEVNRECYISRKDFAPCMQSIRETAINVTAKHPNEDGFINFMLAISDSQRCCESFGAEFVWIKDPTSEVIDVSHIVLSDKDELSIVDESLYLHEGEYVIATVYGIDDVPICCGYVYNSHNGYYSHTVFFNDNFETELYYL